MLPSLQAVLDAHAFLARRHDLSGDRNETAIAQALAEAAALAAGHEDDEPAALFFAFARRPRALGGLWRRFTQMLAEGQARAVGAELRCDAADLARLRLDVAQGLPFGQVRAWFAGHLRPTGTPG